MTVADLGTHAELEARRRYSDPSDCGGRMRVVGQGEIWEIECNRCGFLAGVPAREVDPSLHSHQLLKRRRDASGIPGELCGISLPTSAVGATTAAKRWAAGDMRGLLLTGSVGVGKTHLAAAAAWARMVLDPVRWLSVPVLFARLALAFSDGERQDALRVLAGEGGLVLDDIDKARGTEFAAEALFTAIDVRVTAGAPLLVTTNLMPSALRDHFPSGYGSPIVSRLVGYCETFALEGRDRRLEGRAA